MWMMSSAVVHRDRDGPWRQQNIFVYFGCFSWCLTVYESRDIVRPDFPNVENFPNIIQIKGLNLRSVFNM